MAVFEIKAYSSIWKFRGEKHEDVKCFFLQLDRFHDLDNTSEEKKAGLLPFSLEGRSLDFYEGCNEALKRDYEQIKDAIILHFKNNKSEAHLWQELTRLNKKSDQTVLDFYLEIQKKANRIHGLTDRELKFIFIGGLPMQIRKQVEACEPSTLNMAFEKARLFEQIEDESEIGLTVEGLQEFSIRLQGELNEKTAMLEENEQNMKKGKQEVEKLLGELEEQKAKLAENVKNREVEKQKIEILLQDLEKQKAEVGKRDLGCNTCNSDHRVSKSRILRCFCCGKKGHKAKNCWVRRRLSERGKRSFSVKYFRGDKVTNNLHCCAGRLVHAAIIYPKTKRTVSLYPTQKMLPYALEITGFKANRYQGVKVHPSRVVEKRGRVPCVIENSSPRIIRLEAGARVATLRHEVPIDPPEINTHDKGERFSGIVRFPKEDCYEPGIPNRKSEFRKKKRGSRKRRYDGVEESGQYLSQNHVAQEVLLGVSIEDPKVGKRSRGTLGENAAVPVNVIGNAQRSEKPSGGYNCCLFCFAPGKERGKGLSATPEEPKQVMTLNDSATRSVGPREKFDLSKGNHTIFENTLRRLKKVGKVITKAFAGSEEHSKFLVGSAGKVETKGRPEKPLPEPRCSPEDVGAPQRKQRSFGVTTRELRRLGELVAYNKTEELVAIPVPNKGTKCTYQGIWELLDGLPNERAVQVSAKLRESKTDFLKAKIVHLALY